MRFEEEVTVAAQLSEVWDFLWDVDRLARCVPGCTGVETVVEGERYRATFEDSVGPYRISFDTEVRVAELEPMRRVRLVGEGHDRRLGAAQTVDLSVEVSEDAPGTTTMAVTGDVQVLGKLASLGQFVVKRKVRDLFAGFVSNLREAVEDGTGEGVGRV